MIAAAMELPLFPASGMESSIFPPVLIGLVFATIFAETLGFSYSGLVLGGYLAPILLVKPWSFFAIVVEALVTYLAVVGWDALVRGVPFAAPLFGRDRFYAILLASVGVRLVFEGYALAALGRVMSETFGFAPAFESNLYGVGLVTVPLLANLFWKPGLVRGAIPASLTIGLTTLVTSYVLVPYTNYSLSRWQLAYEDVAINFPASSRAYLIVLIGAALAHRATLDYGFDYGGILIPGLLGLAWFTPLKVVATIGEAVALAGIAHLVLSLPMARHVTIEGPRRLLLIFSLGFLWKYALGFVVSSWQWTLSPSSFYGFGYILPSLVANRILQREHVALVVKPLLQTSFAAAALGLLFGITLERLMPRETTSLAAADEARSEPLPEVLAQVTADIASMRDQKEAAPAPSAFEAGRIRGGLAFLDHPGAVEEMATEPETRARGVPSLASIGYGISIVADLARGRHVFYVRPLVREGLPAGFLVLDPDAQSSVVVSASDDGEHPPLAAYALFEGLRARALLVSRAGEPGLSAILKATTPAFIEALSGADTIAPATLDHATIQDLLRIAGPLTVTPSSDGECRVALSPSTSIGILRRCDPVGEPLATVDAPGGGDASPFGSGDQPTRSRIVAFHDGVMVPLLAGEDSRAFEGMDEEARVSWANRVARGLGYTVREATDGSCALLIAAEEVGDDQGSVWLWPRSSGQQAIFVPRPRAEPAALAWSMALSASLHARALILGSARTARCIDGVQEPRDDLHTLFHATGESLLLRDLVSLVLTVRARDGRWPATLSTTAETLGIADATVSEISCHLTSRGLPVALVGPRGHTSALARLAAAMPDVAGMELTVPAELSAPEDPR